MITKIKENDNLTYGLSQFIIDNETKQIASAEALSRWENSLGEVIFPGAYIGLMEKSGLIVKFDYYMFDNVCRKLSEWKNSEFDNVTIDDLQHISKIIECFVYLGEPGESDLKVVSIEKITFMLPFEKTCVVDVPENVIAEFNKTLVEEKKGKWIVGQADIDKEWDKYKKDLKNLGLDELVSISQKAYDVYVKNSK